MKKNMEAIYIRLRLETVVYVLLHMGQGKLVALDFSDLKLSGWGHGIEC